MSTLVTPSAKSHERVKGRWVRDIEVATRKEWFLYYTKMVIGSPVPWLFAAYICLNFVSRAGLEIAAWASAILTGLYIIADRFSKNREFSFFRIGSDFFLLGYAAVGLAGAVYSDSFFTGLATLGGVRWVLLLYLITYCWALFPGLNRLYFLMIGTASAVTVYGIWQHFVGLDLIRQASLAYAPTPGNAYFEVTGFFNSPEIFGTLLATVLPLPAAAFLLDESRGVTFERVLSLGCVLLLSLGVFWTYRPGMWMAAVAGLVITLLMVGGKGRGQLTLIGALAVFIVGVSFATYSSPDRMLTEVQTQEFQRAEHQRAQINTQVNLWQENTWIGVGRKALAANNYDPGTGNVYFQILAQSGVLGVSFYMLFLLSFLLSTYHIFKEIPRTHYWHRVLIAGGLASQISFHLAGLYWSTMAEAYAVNFFVLLASSISYLSEHYSRGLVPDDHAL